MKCFGSNVDQGYLHELGLNSIYIDEKRDHLYADLIHA
jgi:hypothetical protein